MCSEICPPRMSFSCDVVVSPLQRQSSSPSIMVAASDSSDFEFNVRATFDYQSSSADELFADGKILPSHPPPATRRLIKPPPPPPPLPPPSPPPPIYNSSGTAAQVILDQSEVKLGSCNNTKSFWGFKRSMSLNSNNCKKSFFSISSLPPLLSRSNSTGSVPTQKKTLSKQPSIRIAKSSSLPSSLTSGNWNQKPPLGKKSHSGNGNGGYRVSPVLNVPSPANLFGLGSLFCNNGKDQKKKIRR